MSNQRSQQSERLACLVCGCSYAGNMEAAPLLRGLRPGDLCLDSSAPWRQTTTQVCPGRLVPWSEALEPYFQLVQKLPLDAMELGLVPVAEAAQHLQRITAAMVAGDERYVNRIERRRAIQAQVAAEFGDG